MGNSESSEQPWPCICLFTSVQFNKPLKAVKAGWTKISEHPLLELLQTIEKHCSWFLSLLTLDLGMWEKVDNELEKLLYKGVPLPVSSWSIWTLIKSILEPLQTPESSEGREDDGENPSKGECENAKAEGIEEKTQEALKATVPSAHLFGEDEFALPPLPPLPVLTAGVTQTFPSLPQTPLSVTPPERYLVGSTWGWLGRHVYGISSDNTWTDSSWERS